MHTAQMAEPRLDLVKNEFAEAFVRAAAAKRAADPTSILTALEREAIAHFSESIVELRQIMEEDVAADERRKRARRYLAHTVGASRKHAMDSSRSRDAADVVELVAKLRDQSISSFEATRLIELLTKLDLRRRAGGRYEEIAATDRELGF